MGFVALDVETANPDMASICQVCIVGFSDDGITDKWQSLVNPEDFFDSMNTSIHGIDWNQVKDAPCFYEIYDTLHSYLSQNIVLTHTSFNRVSINRACVKCNKQEISCRWLDNARVVRRAWPKYAYKGYGLANVAENLGIDFNHHEAVEDARATGEIFIQAIRESNISIEGWFDRIKNLLIYLLQILLPKREIQMEIYSGSASFLPEPFLCLEKRLQKWLQLRDVMLMTMLRKIQPY